MNVKKEEVSLIFFTTTELYYYLYFASEKNNYIKIPSSGSSMVIHLNDNVKFELADANKEQKEDFIRKIRLALGDVQRDDEDIDLLSWLYDVETIAFVQSNIDYKEINPNNQTQNAPQNQPFQNNPSQPQTVVYNFQTTPNYGSVYVDGCYVGMASTSKALVPGTHTIRVTKWHCKTVEKQMELRSDNTDIHIKLKQLLNRKFEFYIEGNYLTGGMTAYGATLGGFLGNFNLEATYYMCLDKSEDIYWCDNKKLPVKSNYTPNLIASAKIGYGICIGTRFRITPQAGANYFTLKEEVENDQEIAQNVNSLNLLGSIRFSFAAAKHLKLSITPEYHKNFKTSAGFEVLKETSPIIQDWTEGINVKFGLALFF